ncbi:hypothetical protein LR48_Vigan05g122300 [Vigna angularis]|uniref:Uncharacterized protein n=1 Tax=Phaseolus angularis TaxID=3914 RepID=A0A0L9ULJ4_PHAAN|nr:hypothetical protein LR48_Vigan05g122300 [Vigna angularis]
MSVGKKSGNFPAQILPPVSIFGKDAHFSSFSLPTQFHTTTTHFSLPSCGFSSLPLRVALHHRRIVSTIKGCSQLFRRAPLFRQAQGLFLRVEGNWISAREDRVVVALGLHCEDIDRVEIAVCWIWTRIFRNRVCGYYKKHDSKVEGVAEVEGNGVEGQGQVDVEADEYAVTSWNGSEEDVLNDDEDEVECDIFEPTNQAEIGGPRGLFESDWESESLNSIVESDNTKDDRDRSSKPLGDMMVVV